MAKTGLKATPVLAMLGSQLQPHWQQPWAAPTSRRRPFQSVPSSLRMASAASSSLSYATNPKLLRRGAQGHGWQKCPWHTNRESLATVHARPGGAPWMPATAL